VTDHSFGAHLKQERERRGIALGTVADCTKIAPQLLVALERGDISHWPGGLYRRSFIRAYAQAVGLDPDETARQFLEHFPDAAELPHVNPETVPASSSAAGKPRLLPTILVRIDQPPSAAGESPLTSARQRLTAVAADLAILIVLGLAVSVELTDFWMPLAIAMAAYYAGSVLIFGSTPGVCLLAAGRGWGLRGRATV
jgi:hypothetical protein